MAGAEFKFVKFKRNIFSVLLITSLCCGCARFHVLLRPGATGLVVDSQTEMPVAGAVVTLTRNPAFYGALYVGDGRSLYAMSAVTATNGTFSIPPKQKWGIIDTVGPIDSICYIFSVQKDGYQTYTNQFYYCVGDFVPGKYKFQPQCDPTRDFDTIRLETLHK